MSESYPDGTERLRSWGEVHIESVGAGRILVMRRLGPWLFEGQELFPELGGMSQSVQIADFAEFGRGLIIDGQVQIAEAIDSLYTNALIFPAALSARSRAEWLIVGGGDGAAAREALRFRDTKRVELVDISRMVIQQTQKWIPSFWAGAQSDPRLQIQCMDAWNVLRARAAEGRQVDIIVFDLTDPENADYTPYSESSADHLYTSDAFDLAARILRPGGRFVAQVQELSVLRSQDHVRLRNLLRKSFRHVWSYRVYIEFFGYWESFLIATNDEVPVDPTAEQAIEGTLEHLHVAPAAALWSTAWHRHLFAMPAELRSALA